MIEKNHLPKIFVIPVIETMPADLLTPLAVFLKLTAGSECGFLLESVAGGETLGRYSFIGSDPYLTVSGNSQKTSIDQNGNKCEVTSPILDYVRSQLSRHEFIDRGSELPPFCGGAVGMMDFDCCGFFEPSLENKSNDNVATFMFFKQLIAFDHVRQSIHLVNLVFSDADKPSAIYKLVSEAQERNKELKSVLENTEIKYKARSVSPKYAPESNFKKEDFLSAVRKVKEYILAGDAYQVVLSQCFTKKTDADDVAIYRALRSLNPSPYMFLIRTKEKSLIGASPETLVRLTGNKLEYSPIAGTRPRGKNKEEDENLADEMVRDEKEIAEHMMLVDLGRNDLGRVAKFGTVKVEKLMVVEKYSHVQHLVSRLSARLKETYQAFDALGACFPAGTVSGAPKIRAIQIIRELEPTPRGQYAGSIGYFDFRGNMDTCIAIRTVELRNGVAKVQAGCGIVADSVPENEFEESVNKAKAMLKAVEIAEGSKS
jgi:anthranilate synthase component 1